MYSCRKLRFYLTWTCIFKRILLDICFVISRLGACVCDQCFLLSVRVFSARRTSSTFTLKVVTGSFDPHANIAVYSQVFTSPVVKVPRSAVRDTSSATSRYDIGIDTNIYMYVYSPTFSQQRDESRRTRGVCFALARTGLAQCGWTGCALPAFRSFHDSSEPRSCRNRQGNSSLALFVSIFAIPWQSAAKWIFKFIYFCAFYFSDSQVLPFVSAHKAWRPQRWLWSSEVKHPQVIQMHTFIYYVVFVIIVL